MQDVEVRLTHVIVVSNGDLLGDGVNIAARLQTLAAPGGVCVSDEVYSHVHAKVELGFQDLGLRNLKNIPHPVRAFAIGEKILSDATAKPHKKLHITSASSALILTILGLASFYLTHKQNLENHVHSFILENVPFVNEHTRHLIEEHYTKASFHKSLALSRGGMGFAVGQTSTEQADAMALAQCSLTPGECDIYAEDDEVVWPRPLPMLSEDEVRTSISALYQADALPSLIPSDTVIARDYTNQPSPKALVL